MNRLNGNLIITPFMTLYIREMKRFLKVIYQTIFTPLINASLYLLIFGVSLGNSISLKSGISYLRFLIPGLVMMSVLNNAFQNSSSSIIAGKFSGDLEDLRVVPLGSQQIIWALSFGGLTRGLFVGGVTFFIGEVFSFFLYGHIGEIAHPLWLVMFLICGGLAFAKLGISVAFWAESFDQVSAISSFLLMPLIYLGGVFFSTEGLHPFWQLLSKFNPVLYFINGVRYGMLGATDVDPWLALGVSMVAVVLFHFLGVRSLRVGHYKRW